VAPLRERIAAHRAEDIETRHDLHRNPELGYQERRTHDLVCRRLSELGIAHRGGLAGGTGVLAYLPASTPSSRTVALRADMDALPIQEETGLDYASATPGVMHACGHDGHTTMLLAAARTLTQVERPNHVLMLFQPAEEGGAGGKRLTQEGCLRGEILGSRADVIYGLHGYPGQTVGNVTVRTGPMMASAHEIWIEIKGKGSHAAYPHYGIDPIVVAAHIVTALQTVASRTINPLESVVVTIGKVDAGVAHNVIPESARLKGTLRTLNEETFERATSRIRDIVRNVAAAFGAEAEATFNDGYPVTFNHAEPTERFRQIARETLGDAHLHEEPTPSMGGEDFSFYGREVPACFFFLGIRPEGQETYPNLHAPTFDFNDDALPVGAEMLASLALRG